MTTPPGEPYQYGDDTVAARLEVDVPAEAINNLTDLSRLTADIRANMEATAKYNQDYVEYLKQLPTALGEVDAAQSRMSSRSSLFQGDMTPRSGDPFAGRGRDGVRPEFEGKLGAGRDVDKETLINLARNNPRQIGNMAADRGMDDYFASDQSYVLPRPEPGPRPGAGRSMQFSGAGRPPSSPTSPRASTGPGDEEDRPRSERTAGTTTGRQVTPTGTENQAERAAERLLAEIERQADNRDASQKSRDFGQNIEHSELFNYLNREVGTGGTTDPIGFAGGLGEMAQEGAQSFQETAQQADSQASSLIAQAAEVAATNPELAMKLTQKARELSTRSARMARVMPVVKGAGIVGGVAAGAAGINAAVQKVGETYNNIEGYGQQMGGGFSEGLAFETQVRTMAMNPFITLEQSRKIMQGALQSGYTGKEFDTITEFMAENLKDMNIEVAESTKLLKKNVLQGGQDMDNLQGQLSQNQAMAGNLNLTADQIQSMFSNISGGLVDQGAGGANAGALTQSIIALLGNNDMFKDTGATDISNALSTNTSLQAAVARRSGAAQAGVPLETTGMYLAENMEPVEASQAIVEGLGDLLRPYVAQYQAAGGDTARKSRAALNASKFLTRIYGRRVTPNEAQEMLEQYMSGEILNRPAEAEAELEAEGGGTMNENQGGFMGQVYDNLNIGSTLKGGYRSLRSLWNKGPWGTDESRANAQASLDEQVAEEVLQGQLVAAGTLNPTTGKTYTPEVLEQLALSEYGGSINDVTIVDENGKERKLGAGDLTNQQTMEKLRSGQIKVKTEEGGVQSLREWNSARGVDENGNNGGMTHEIKMSDETRRFFGLDSRPNTAQQKADRGRGSRNSRDAELGGYGPQRGPGR